MPGALVDREQRGGRAEAGTGDRARLDTEAQAGAHVAFDRRDADLAVALRRVRVTAGEERTLAPDGQPQRGARGQVARIDIAAALVRREDRRARRDVGVRAHRAEEGRRRDADPRRRLDAAALAQVEGPDPRLRELVGQQPLSGQDGSPAPLAGLEREDVDPQRVAGPRARHPERAGEVIERREVQRRLCVGVALVHLAVARHAQRVVDDVPRGDLQDGRERVVPLVMDERRVDRVLHRRGQYCHQRELATWLAPTDPRRP